ncbi:MAG: restriction endonuclease subunit S, partial [Candidatus Aerophobetes bacterium]|nr:restriction endonuclease subunit S [Candidatus Aerophobetes bacterium]
MIVSEIRYERINGRLRFDAEYYQPRFLEIEETLKQSKCINLREIIKFSKLRRDPRNNPDKEFRYIDISNINIFTGEINSQKLKGYQAPSRARKVVKEKDIVLSTVRPNRNAVAIIPKELGGEICSTGFTVIKAEKINPYFLFVFLKTKYTIDQLVRQAMASMYPAVSEEDIGSVLVPFPSSSFQQKIESLIKEAYKKKDEANNKYKEAEQLLNKTLGIEDLELKENKIFETRFSNIETNQRIDADFYKPLYIQSIEILKEGAQKGIFIVKRLGEISKVSKGIEVGSDAYTNSGKLFLRVSNLSEREITISDSAEFMRENFYNELKGKYKPEPGEVLCTKDATVGIAYPIGEDFNDFIISSGILRIKPSKEIDPYYLTLTLNSIACRSQAERHSIGAVIKHYAYSKTKDLLVPIVPLKKQKPISNLVKESFAFCKEAKRLLDKAKKDVENFIEGKGLIQRKEIEANYKDTTPLLFPEKIKLTKFPVHIKYKEYLMLDGSKKELVLRIGDGSIIKRFEKTSMPQKKTDVVCPHFLELKWATGCPYDCSWCYLKGTFRFLPYKTKPHIK